MSSASGLVDESVPLVIGVTGHRDLLPAELAQVRAQISQFLQMLSNRFPDLPLVVLTGVASGADTLACQVAQELGCKIINVLPMPLALYEQDFPGDEAATLKQLISAHETLELSLLPDLHQDMVARPGPERDLQYAQLGSFLAAHSHILLALWDGKFSSAVGGTSQVVDFHQRDVSALADDQIRSRLDTADDESDLVYHIVCSRQSAGAPAQELVAGAASWFTRDDVAPRVDELPARYVDVFSHMQAFNRDLQSVSKQAQLYALEPQQVASSAGKTCAAIQRVFGLSDALATRYQKRVLWALRCTLFATVLAGLCFIIYADFSDQENLIWGYFLFVLLALVSYWTAFRKDWQRRYLDYRVLAEALRVQYYWALGGVEMNNPSRYSHDSFFQGRDLQLGWIRNVMRVTGLYADTNVAPSAEQLAAAIKGWVGDADSGQLGYYRSKAGDKLAKHHQTGWITASAFLLGLAAAGVLAMGAAHLSDTVANWLVAIMGLLPIMAAARQNYAHRVAERELAAQYATMLRVFENANRLLQQNEGAHAQQAILRDLGEAALNENAQWVLRQRERPLPGGDAVG